MTNLSPMGVVALSSQQLEAYTSVVHPAAVMLMNDVGGAKAYKTAHPEVEVFSRIFDGSEGNMHFTPGKVLAYSLDRAREVGNSGVAINLLCEPSLSGGVGDIKRLVDECIRALDWLVPRGFRVGLPHGAFYGHTDEASFLALDPLVDYICRYVNQLSLLMDEYFAGVHFSGVGDARFPGGNEAGHIYPPSWVDSPTRTYWHSGSTTVKYFDHRVALGLPLPITYVSEYGADALGDVTAWRNSLIRTAGYDDIRGWKSLQAQYEAWYRQFGWSPAEAYGYGAKAFWEQVYSRYPNIRALMFYCIGTNNDPIWDQFRVDDQPKLWAILGSVKRSVIVPPTPVIQPVGKPTDVGIVTNKGTLVTSGTIRLRNAPTTAAAIVQEVPNGAKIQRYGGHVTLGDGLNWSWCELFDLNDAVINGGWMALLVATWIAQIFTPPLPKPLVTFGLAKVDLKAVYCSQYHSLHGSNGCGPALLAMMEDFKRLKIDPAHTVFISENDASNAMNRAYNAFTGIPDRVVASVITPGIVSIAEAAYNLKLKVVVGVTPQMIVDQLNAGLTVGILYRRGAITGWQDTYNYAGPHFGEVTQWGECSDGSRWFGILEPLLLDSGAPPLTGSAMPSTIQAIESELVDGLYDAGSTNTANQAMFFDPINFVQAPVNDPAFTDAQWLAIDKRISAALDARA